MTTTIFHRVLWILLGLGVVLSLGTLVTYPLPTCDETSYTSAALALSVPGASAPLSYGQGMPGADSLFAIVSFGRKISTYNLALAGLLRVVGTSLLSARFFAWCGWLAAGAMTFLLGRKIHSQTVGLLSALLFMTSTKAYLTGHTARPEIWVTAALLAGTFAALTVSSATKPLQWWVIVGAGAISVWAAEIHMQGLLFTAAIGVVILITLGIKQGRWRDFALFSAGVALGITVWLMMLAASGFGIEDMVRFGSYASPVASRSMPGASRIRWIRYLVTMPDWFKLVFWSSGGPIAAAEALFAAVGISAAVWRRDRDGLVLLGVALISLLGFGIAHPNRWVQYGVLWSPIWYLLGALAISRIRRHEWAVLTLAGTHLTGMAWLGWQYRDSFSIYDAAGKALSEAVPAGTSVAADPIWWWHLNDRQFLSDEYFMYANDTDRVDVQRFLGIGGEISEEEAAARLFEQIAPEYFVVDQALACHTDPDSRFDVMRETVEARCESLSVVGRNAGIPLNASSVGQANTIFRCGN